MIMRIKVTNLSKVYKTKDGIKKALDDISFESEDEILGILGPNGAGKSTLINCIVTLLKPTIGEITIGSYSVKNSPNSVRKSVSLAFQEPPFDSRLSVEKNLFFHGKACQIPSQKRKKIIKELLDEFDLTKSVTLKPYELSGGMRKKFDLIRVFMRDSPIYIFDEPTAMVDIVSKNFIWEKIKILSELGKTILLATNDLSEAENISERVLILNNGKKVAMNSVKDLRMKIKAKNTLRLAGNLKINTIESILSDLEINADIISNDDSTITIIADGIESFSQRLFHDLYLKKNIISSFEFSRITLNELFFKLIQN